MELDVETIERVSKHFFGRVQTSFGWGTNLTNDFRGCDTEKSGRLDPISIVCKVTRANGKPAVKLSDNPNKVTGPDESVKWYQETFGVEGMKRQVMKV